MQFDLKSNGSRLGTVGTLAISNGTFGWVGAPAAVQALNINAALNGEQLTIERITGNVATGGVVGSFSAKGAAKASRADARRRSTARSCSTRRGSRSPAFPSNSSGRRESNSRRATQITDVSWLVAQNPLAFGGTVGFAAEDPPLNLSVKGLVDLRVLSALTSAVAFDGNADVNTRIEGTVAKPLLDGRIMLEEEDEADTEKARPQQGRV